METKNNFYKICLWFKHQQILNGRSFFASLFVLFLIMFQLEVQAQFLGGDGRGDIMGFSAPLIQVVSVPAQFLGGDGRGDIMGFSAPLTQVVSVPAQFVGGDGRGDIMGLSSPMTQVCMNPTNSGVVAAAQSGTSPFNPVAFTSSSAASGGIGIIEYKWQSSTTSSSAGFIDITSSNAASYDAGTLTVTTWYKRLARVSCSADWTGAVESNVLEVSLSPEMPKIYGKIAWRTDPTVGIINTSVALAGEGTGTVTTLLDGQYSFNITGSNYTVTPTKSTGKFNGVTALDVSRLAQLVSGTGSFTSPYDYIAGDVDINNQLNTLDVAYIKQALLNNPIALLQFKKSWRFVPAAHTFPTPYGTGAFWSFPEKINYVNITTSQTDQDFVGIKMGDLVAPNTNPAVKPAPAVPVVFTVPNLTLQSDSLVEVPFRCRNFDDILALQTCFWFNPAVLSLENIVPVSGMPFQTDNFGTWDLSDGYLRLVWAVANAQSLLGQPESFRLKFRVLEGGQSLQEVLKISEKQLEAMAWHTDNGPEPVALSFYPVTASQQRGEATGVFAFALYQNEPNPFEDQTTIGFTLPAASSATLTVYDEIGRVVFTQKGEYGKGYNAISLDRVLLNTTGVLYYTLETATNVATKKMIQVK